MTEARNVEYGFNAVELTELKQKTSHEGVMNALGYLSQWNFTFPRVRIIIAGDELVARYFDGAGMQCYVIGAVWHGDHFGFHS